MWQNEIKLAPDHNPLGSLAVLLTAPGAVDISELEWIKSSHVVAMHEGCMIIALAFASLYADLAADTGTAAAYMIVVASGFQDLQGVVNHITKVGDDQLKAKSYGFVGFIQEISTSQRHIIILVFLQHPCCPS